MPWRGSACFAAEPGSAAVGPRSWDVRAFGARGDGATPDTAAINRAIEAAHAAGGGTVYFSAGTYLSFSIRLRSHVALHLDHGAVLLAGKIPFGIGERCRVDLEVQGHAPQSVDVEFVRVDRF